MKRKVQPDAGAKTNGFQYLIRPKEAETFVTGSLIPGDWFIHVIFREPSSSRITLRGNTLPRPGQTYPLNSGSTTELFNCTAVFETEAVALEGSVKFTTFSTGASREVAFELNLETIFPFESYLLRNLRVQASAPSNYPHGNAITGTATYACGKGEALFAGAVTPERWSGGASQVVYADWLTPRANVDVPINSGSGPEILVHTPPNSYPSGSFRMLEYNPGQFRARWTATFNSAPFTGCVYTGFITRPPEFEWD